MTWNLPGSGERILSQHFASASAVSGMRSMHLETVHAFVWSGARCAKCGGEGLIPVDAKGRPNPSGDRNVECPACRGLGMSRAFRSQSRPHEAMFRTARCEPCKGATGRVDCPACRGAGYVEALTANLSEIAHAGAPPEIDDALWHQWARVARRLDALPPQSRAVLTALFGDVGSELDRVAVYPLTTAGRTLAERGLRRVRNAHAKARVEDLGLSVWDVMLAEAARSDSRKLKTEADCQVEALVSRAFADWNAAGPARRDEATERLLARAAGVTGEVWTLYRTDPGSVPIRDRTRCATIERWARRAQQQRAG